MATQRQLDEANMLFQALMLKKLSKSGVKKLGLLFYIMDRAENFGWHIEEHLSRKQIAAYRKLMVLRSARMDFPEMGNRKGYDYFITSTFSEDDRETPSFAATAKLFGKNDPKEVLDEIIRENLDNFLESLGEFQKQIATSIRSQDTDKAIAFYTKFLPDETLRFIIRYLIYADNPEIRGALDYLVDYASDEVEGEDGPFFAFARFTLPEWWKDRKALEQQEIYIRRLFSQGSLLVDRGFIERDPTVSDPNAIIAGAAAGLLIATGGYRLTALFKKRLTQPFFSEEAALEQAFGTPLVLPPGVTLRTITKSQDLSKEIDAFLGNVESGHAYLPDQTYNLIVYGPPGNGKTTLMAALAREIEVRTGKPCRAYNVWGDLENRYSPERGRRVSKYERGARAFQEAVDTYEILQPGSSVLLVLDDADGMLLVNAQDHEKNILNRAFDKARQLGIPFLGTANKLLKSAGDPADANDQRFFEESLRTRIRLVQMPPQPVADHRKTIIAFLTKTLGVSETALQEHEIAEKLTVIAHAATPLQRRELTDALKTLRGLVGERNIRKTADILKELENLIKRDVGTGHPLHKPPFRGAEQIYPDLFSISDGHQVLEWVDALTKELHAHRHGGPSTWYRNFRRKIEKRIGMDHREEWWGKIFLLHGLPGTGKKTFAWLASKNWGYDGVQLVPFSSLLSGEKLDDGKLMAILADAEQNKVAIAITGIEGSFEKYRNYAGLFEKLRAYKAPTFLLTDKPMQAFPHREEIERQTIATVEFAPYSVEAFGNDFVTYQKAIAWVILTLQGKGENADSMARAYMRKVTKKFKRNLQHAVFGETFVKKHSWLFAEGPKLLLSPPNKAIEESPVEKAVDLLFAQAARRTEPMSVKRLIRPAAKSTAVTIWEPQPARLVPVRMGGQTATPVKQQLPNQLPIGAIAQAISIATNEAGGRRPHVSDVFAVLYRGSTGRPAP
jgi:DNA polymerase III delta prime subunit